MQTYALLTLDIDGTLLDPVGAIPPANLAALRGWLGQPGRNLALATGRNLTITRPIASAIYGAVGRSFYLILQDGCLLLRFPDLTVLQYRNLPLPLAQTACELFRQARQAVILFDPLPEGQGFKLVEHGPLPGGVRRYIAAKNGQYARWPSAQALTEAPSKIVTLDTPERVMILSNQLQDRLPQARILQTEAVRLNAWFLEVGPAQASKLAALQALTRHLGLDLGAVMAIGDAENDLEMIRAAGLGLAMGNASERVKQAADQIIGSNAEAGVAQFLARNGGV